MGGLKMEGVLESVGGTGRDEAELGIGEQGTLDDIELVHRSGNDDVSACIALHVGHEVLEQTIEEQDIDAVGIDIDTQLAVGKVGIAVDYADALRDFRHIGHKIQAGRVAVPIGMGYGIAHQTVAEGEVIGMDAGIYIGGFRIEVGKVYIAAHITAKGYALELGQRKQVVEVKIVDLDTQRIGRVVGNAAVDGEELVATVLEAEIAYRDILGGDIGLEGVEHPSRVVDGGVRTVALHLGHEGSLVVEGKAYLGIEGSVEQGLGIGLPHQAEVYDVVLGAGQQVHGGAHLIIAVLRTAHIGIQSALRGLATHADIAERHTVELDLRHDCLQTEVLGMVIDEALDIDGLVYFYGQQQELLQGAEGVYLEVGRAYIIGMLVSLGAIAAYGRQIAVQVRKDAVVERLVGEIATHRALHEVGTEREHLFVGVGGIESYLLDDVILIALVESEAVETHRAGQMIDVGPHSIGIDTHAEMLAFVHLYQIHCMEVETVGVKGEAIGRSHLGGGIAALELEASVGVVQADIATYGLGIVMAFERHLLIAVAQQLHLCGLSPEGSLHGECALLGIKVAGSLGFEHEVGLHERTRRYDLTYIDIGSGEGGGKGTLPIHRGMGIDCAYVGRSGEVDIGHSVLALGISLGCNGTHTDNLLGNEAIYLGGTGLEHAPHLRREAGLVQCDMGIGNLSVAHRCGCVDLDYQVLMMGMKA